MALGGRETYVYVLNLQVDSCGFKIHRTWLGENPGPMRLAYENPELSELVTRILDPQNL